MLGTISSDNFEYKGQKIGHVFHQGRVFAYYLIKGFRTIFLIELITIFNFIVQQVELEVSLIEALIVINVKGIRQNWLDLDSKVNFHH